MLWTKGNGFKEPFKKGAEESGTVPFTMFKVNKCLKLEVCFRFWESHGEPSFLTDVYPNS